MIQPNDSPALDTRTVDGVTLEFQGAKPLDQSRTAVYYKTRAEASDAFADMLGVPRVVNPDGSIVLPQAYGENGQRPDGPDGVPGLPAGSSSAIFNSTDIQPGATVRFGPFFRSSNSGFNLETTGAALLAGQHMTIDGEDFIVAADTSAAMTNIKFVNTDPAPSVMATHPASVVTVSFDGVAQAVVHGSGNFAKTPSYDVNANQSSVVVKGELGPNTAVVITNTSAGNVVKGDFDFPLK